MAGKRLGAATIARSGVSWAVLEPPSGVAFGPGSAKYINREWVTETGSFDDITDIHHAVSEISNVFKAQKCSKVSLSCFGPFQSISLDTDDENSYGSISSQQKSLNAGGYNIISRFEEQTGVRPNLITDANAVALGEIVRRYNMREYPFQTEKKFKNINNAFNRTVVVALIFGKGIGGGVAFGDTIFQFNYHPEIGHIPVSRMTGDESRVSVCVHDDCVSGFASAEALERDSSGTITPESLEKLAYYAAQLSAIVTYTFGPDVITLTGSTIRKHPYIVPRVREHLTQIFQSRKNGVLREDWQPYIHQENDIEGFLGIADPASYIFGTMVHAVRAAGKGG